MNSRSKRGQDKRLAAMQDIINLRPCAARYWYLAVVGRLDLITSEDRRAYIEYIGVDEVRGRLRLAELEGGDVEWPDGAGFSTRTTHEAI